MAAAIVSGVEPAPKLLQKGFFERGQCKYVQDTLWGALEQLLVKNSLPDALDYARDACRKLLGGDLAADVLSSCATLTPGLYACSTNPTVFTWKFNIASAKATLAATPAEMTIALSLMGRFLSRSGSSWGYGQSGSSSGKATNPPSGTHRSEYSTSGPL